MSRGKINVSEIKKDMILFEYVKGFTVKSQVISEPVYDFNTGFYTWKCKNLLNNNEITYSINPKYPQYSPEIYDYEAKQIVEFI